MNNDIDLSRPRGFGELLSATMSLAWKHRAVLYTVVLVIGGPINVLAEGLVRNMDPLTPGDPVTSDQLATAVALVVLVLISTPLVTAAVARAVERIGAGEQVGVADTLRAGLAAALAALAAILLGALVTMIGFVLLVVPGVILAVRLLVVGQAAAIERPGATGALRRSMELTRGHWWRLLGMILAVLVVTAFSGAALTAPFDAMGGTPALAAAALVQSAIDMVTAVFLTLVYYDLRARREAATAAVAAPDAWG
jgi:hypothetical protein